MYILISIFINYRKHVSIENMTIVDLTIDDPFDQFPPAIETKLEFSRSDTSDSNVNESCDRSRI